MLAMRASLFLAITACAVMCTLSNADMQGTHATPHCAPTARREFATLLLLSPSTSLSCVAVPVRLS